MIRSIAFRSTVGIATIAAASLLSAPSANADPISDVIGALFSMIDTGSASDDSSTTGGLYGPLGSMAPFKNCTIGGVSTFCAS